MTEKGIVITTNDEISIREFARDGHGVLNTALREVVGDSIENVSPMYLQHPYCFVCNGDGLLLELPTNTAGCIMYGTAKHGHPIVGNIVVLKKGVYNGEVDLIGIPDGEIERLCEQLKKLHPILREVSA